MFTSVFQYFFLVVIVSLGSPDIKSESWGCSQRSPSLMTQTYLMAGTARLFSARLEPLLDSGMSMYTSMSCVCINLTRTLVNSKSLVHSPDGKKFRSRNELRSYFNQSGSSLNSEDFDFSVKGKGHHNKGKSPTKKEAESSKENVKAVRKPPTTPTVTTSRRTPASKPSAPSPERPKRELRKKPPKEEVVVEEKPPVEPEEELMDDADDLPEQISNVKLKVKVGYTATGAMIRPATNGRKKKRRFRNMTIKKKPKPVDKPPAEAAPPKPSPVKQVTKEVTASSTVNKDEKKETRPTTAARKRSKASEPVAGPSGLQKVKRSPRRILKRKMAGDVNQSEEDDDDEDLDYVCSLYPANNAENGNPKTAEAADANDASSASADESTKDRVSSAKEELNGASSPEAPETINGLTDEVGPMNVMAEEHHIHHHEDMDQIGDGQMQVVVIGDSVEASHSYAKPHSL